MVLLNIPHSLFFLLSYTMLKTNDQDSVQPVSPTPGQTKTILSFILASEECRGNHGSEELENGKISRYALCMRKKIPEKRREVEIWIKTHPKEYEKLHQKIREKMINKSVDENEFKVKLLQAIRRKIELSTS